MVSKYEIAIDCITGLILLEIKTEIQKIIVMMIIEMKVILTLNHAFRYFYNTRVSKYSSSAADTFPSNLYLN